MNRIILIILAILVVAIISIISIIEIADRISEAIREADLKATKEYHAIQIKCIQLKDAFNWVNLGGHPHTPNDLEQEQRILKEINEIDGCGVGNHTPYNP